VTAHPREVEAVLDRFALRPTDVDELAVATRSQLTPEVEAVVGEQTSPGGAIPVVDFDDVERGTVPESARAAIRRRGCVVVRGTFERAEAEAWDREISEYLDRNRFGDAFEARYGELAVGGSGIIGIYWSRPQVLARQHPRMAAVRRFVNGFWRSESGDTVWFDPEHDIGYPDRLRRRAPGATARGLQPHVDAATTRGWRLAENVGIFEAVLAGDPERYDPWDAAHRTGTDDVSTAPSSAFRTFQGWTALSDMRPVDGGLHILPIPAAITLSMLTSLADDTDERPRARLDDALATALTPIPAVEPGDTVWWHGDLFHSVAAASNTERWSNVMYIGSAPRCPRNDRYASSMFERFESGRSPVDFPDEDFEVDFAGRARLDDLNDVGRRQFGLDPLVRT
jgi:hypothetical protein